MSAKKLLYDFIVKEGCRSFTTEELGNTSGVQDWPRCMRQLKQDGWIDYSYDRSSNTYSIEDINHNPTKSARQNIDGKTRARILHRDGSLCQMCGASPAKDRIKLHIDHKVPVEWGGGNNDENLWTVCERCNLGKKAYFESDFSPEVMKAVMKETTGYGRLSKLFELSKGKKLSPTILQGISGIRDWTRTVRLIRAKKRFEIEWVRPSEEYPDGYYFSK